MEHTEGIHAVVLEKDRVIVDSIERHLAKRSYIVTTLSEKKEALSLLGKKHYQLAIVGDTEANGSVFKAMRDIVRTSPMTSIILITDLSQKEVDEKAEGYGILGRVTREIPSEDLTTLLNNFEKILKSFSQSKL